MRCGEGGERKAAGMGGGKGKKRKMGKQKWVEGGWVGSKAFDTGGGRSGCGELAGDL